jgi:hypothetical protein
MKTAGMVVCVWMLALASTSSAIAQSAPISEKQKIEALIAGIGRLQDAKIVRNGWSYDPSTAVRFLHGKWTANESEIKTARDFIDKVASFSGTSGKPYLIRFKDGRELPSREFLLAELKKIEASALSLP